MVWDRNDLVPRLDGLGMAVGAGGGGGASCCGIGGD